MSDEYQNIDISKLKGQMRDVTNPIYVPDPEKLELNQIPTLTKMLDKLHFTMLEMQTELEIVEAQIVAINCAISALEKFKLKKDNA